MANYPAKILVGIDLSPASDDVVHHALALARRSGAEVVLAHISDQLEYPATLAEPPPEVEAYYARVREATGRQREQLEALRQRHAGQGVALSHAVIDGFPETSLWTEACAIGADLIVLGSSSTPGLGRRGLGGVAHRVVRIAERDVLVARGPASDGGYRNICVATDLSPASEAALARAREVAARDATIDVVTAWSLPRIDDPPGDPGDARVVRQMTDWLASRGAELLARQRPTDLAMTFRTLVGPAPGALLSYVADGRHDLLVVGSHGRRGLRRLLLGSVAETIARTAPCSVLVARCSQ